jgi:ligand-binding sensor domain-containing protein
MQRIHQRGLLGLIVVGLGVVLGGEAAAHPYLIDVWQTDRGLPHNSVTSILQTRDGYLWFGTFNGLVRFDGVRFKIFDAGNTPGLKSNRILKLYEDRQGRLWIGTETGGLTRYSEGRFLAFGPEAGLADWQVTALEEDQQGAMWIGTASGGVSRLSGDRFTTFGEANGLVSASVTTVTRDLAGQIWLVAGTTLCRFAEGRWITWPRDERGASLRAEKVFASRDGGLWIVQGDRVKKCRTGAVTEDLVPGLTAGAVVTVVSFVSGAAGAAGREGAASCVVSAVGTGACGGSESWPGAG